MKIWITGASGMLGQDLTAVLRRAGHDTLTTDREVDVTDSQVVRAWLCENPVDYVVNCAAYTAVDKAESDREMARCLNAKAPGILAQATAEHAIGLLHISTDYVLSGRAPTPLLESNPMNPSSVYGKTKAEGESLILKFNPKHWIVRTAWLYGLQGNNFVKTMLRLMVEKESLKVIDDQWGTPTWTVDLSLALLRIMEQGDHPGVYHYSSEGKITWYQFACEIQRQALDRQLLDKVCQVNPCTTSEYPTPAIRPNWSVMSKDKIRDTFAVEIPFWKDALGEYLDLEKFLRESN